MRFLFDRRGQHIAIELEAELYSPMGSHVGHYLPDEGIFIDTSGRYLGEVLYGNRLVFNRHSPFRDSDFGNRSHHGNVGNYGNPGNRGAVSLPWGYEDIDAGRIAV